jgi:serine phosphatase RsbU (regulator of sigma subunit)
LQFKRFDYLPNAGFALMNPLFTPNILIVDDEHIELQFLFETLQGAFKDAKIFVASNSEQALKVVESKRPSLILLDWELGSEDGLELLKRMKRNPAYEGIAFILMASRLKTSAHLELALDSGALDFLRKPIDHTELVARVRKCLQLTQHTNTLKNTIDDLTSSIIYASRLQNAILPNQEVMDRFFSDYFIVFEPKDILSGDFFWFEYKRSDFIIVAGDCTGHGVPGALMSILGVNFLNQIFKDYGILSTEVMLEELNEKVCVMLKQTYGEYKGIPPLDGMDIALCHVNIDQHRIRFSGAHRPLYFFSQKQFHKIKGTPKSIGGTSLLSRISFAYHDLQLQPDDTIYMFSDGITDQFDKNNNRRFGNRQWQELLEGIQEQDMISQGETIKRVIAEWRGNVPQTDDILVIGFRV